MKSIRGHLLWTLMPALIMVTAVGGVALYLVVRTMLVTQFDQALATKANSLASLTTWTPKGIDFDFTDAAMPEFEAGQNAEYFEIHLADGSVLERSRSLDGRELVQGAWPDSARIWDAQLPDGRRGRMVARRFQPQPDVEGKDEAASESEMNNAPAATVVVGRSRSEIDGPLSALAAGLLGAGVVMCGAFMIVVLRSVNAGLRPLEQVGLAVEAIDSPSLSSRVHIKNLPDELRPMCIKLNELLARLEEAFTRERRFTSAAAHELRTPVSELRTLAEVSLKWPADSSTHQQSMQQVLDAAVQMQRMIESLLSLSRRTDGQIDIRPEPMPVRPILDAVSRPMEGWIQEKSIAFVNSVPSELQVNADRAILSSILRNVLENAVEYSPNGGQVEVRATAQPATLDLFIANTNDTLSPQDLRYVCEPFWRSDEARSSRVHNGLGMAIVQQLATSIGAQVNLALDDQSRFEVRLSIPAAHT